MMPYEKNHTASFSDTTLNSKAVTDIRPDNPAVVILGIRLDTGFDLPDIRQDTGYGIAGYSANWKIKLK
jgi:hypothetical protein